MKQAPLVSRIEQELAQIQLMVDETERMLKKVQNTAKYRTKILEH